jgi:hypothetical protein
MTGIVTASMMDLIISGSLCRTCVSRMNTRGSREVWYHSRDPTVVADICWYALQCHDCASPSLFSNASLMELSSISSEREGSLPYLFGVYNIHDHTTLKHYVRKDPTLRRGSASQTLSIWANPDLTCLLDRQGLRQRNEEMAYTKSSHCAVSDAPILLGPGWSLQRGTGRTDALNASLILRGVVCGCRHCSMDGGWGWRNEIKNLI